MTVKHPLGVAGRAGCIAERRRRSLVKHRPDQDVVFRLDERLIAETAGKLGREVCAVRHRHQMLDGGKIRPQLLNEIGEGDVEQQHPIFGVVDDVVDLLGKQARIDGVQHRADAGYSEVELHVTMGVPGERRDAIARPDAQFDQRLCELCRARPQGSIIAAMDRPLAGLADDLRPGMETRRMLDQTRDQ